MIGRIILFIVIASYAALSAAIIWHLKIYAFSRSADSAIYIFSALACLLAVLSVVFYGMVDWSVIAAFYPYLFMGN